MFWSKKKAEGEVPVEETANPGTITTSATTETRSFWESIWPVLACGAGLFSDGYINNVISSVGTVLTLQYGDLYSNSAAQNVAAIAFAGTVSICIQHSAESRQRQARFLL